MKLHHKSPRIEQKRRRSQAAEKLTITCNCADMQAHKFDANKASRQAMVEYILILEPLETVLWQLADNTKILVTREDLQLVLKQAVLINSELWLID